MVKGWSFQYRSGFPLTREGRQGTDWIPAQTGMTVSTDLLAIVGKRFNIGMRHCPESLNISIDRLSNIGYNKGRIIRGDAPNSWRKTGGSYDRNFYPWDAADYLHTEEDARLYLEACSDDDPGDGSLIRAALQDIARSGNMSREELTKHNPNPAADAFLDLNDRPSALPKTVDPGLR